jgi:hypothetical protein
MAEPKDSAMCAPETPDEVREARIIGSAMRCSVRFEDDHTAILSWPGAFESWRVIRRGAGWRSLCDLSRQMVTERVRESVGEGSA